MNSAIMNAAAPITGGKNWPLVEAAVSTAPATSGLKPAFFMTGIVSEPVIAVLATELPTTLPKKPLARTAALAGPPRKRTRTA